VFTGACLLLLIPAEWNAAGGAPCHVMAAAALQHWRTAAAAAAAAMSVSVPPHASSQTTGSSSSSSSSGGQRQQQTTTADGWRQLEAVADALQEVCMAEQRPLFSVNITSAHLGTTLSTRLSTTSNTTQQQGHSDSFPYVFAHFCLLLFDFLTLYCTVVLGEASHWLLAGCYCGESVAHKLTV
jgi:hypothetical protein